MIRSRIHAFMRALLAEHRSPARVAAAILVGAIVGCSPLFGFHIVLCVALAFVLGLNQVIVYAAANLSMPPMIPFIGLASVELGEKILRGRFLGLTRELFRSEPARALAHRFFFAWLVGGTVLGAAIGAVGGGVAWAMLARRPRMADPILDAIEHARHRYDREPGRFKWYARMKYVMDPCYRAIAPKIPDGAFTVDLGTGLGMLPVLLGLLGRRALGVEWDHEKAQAGRRAAEGLDVTIVEGDARTFDIPTCDVITIVDVLHYYDADVQRALIARCRAATRLLFVREGDGARKGGSRFTRAVEQTVTKLGWNRGPKVAFRPIEDLEADLRAAGFTVERDEVAGALHPGNVLLVARA